MQQNLADLTINTIEEPHTSQFVLPSNSDNIQMLTHDEISNMFECFYDKSNDGNKGKLQLALSQANMMLHILMDQNILVNGNGIKKYRTAVMTVLQHVILRSQAISKMEMSNMWLIYKSSQNIEIQLNNILDNIDFSKLLLKQNMICKYLGTKGIWDSIKRTLENKKLIGITLPENKKN
jgi:hypothetical protein